MQLYTLLALAGAANASPFLAPRQAVTEKISPTAPPPSRCTGSYSGTFGIAVKKATISAVAKRQVAAQIADGQLQVSKATQIADGQPQAPVEGGVTQIADGQAQAPTGAVTQIADGQPQAPVPTAAPIISEIPDGQVQAGASQTAMLPVIGQIADGQPQAPVEGGVTQIADGQPQAPTGDVTQIADGQPQAPTATENVTQATDGQPAATPTGGSSGKGGLTVTIADGVLTDQDGRTGYIASNFQFQFDEPPQAGAILTAGFSACENGRLALGGSDIFYQCLSGDFYNLYDRSWAEQCEPVHFDIVAK